MKEKRIPLHVTFTVIFPLEIKNLQIVFSNRIDILFTPVFIVYFIHSEYKVTLTRPILNRESDMENSDDSIFVYNVCIKIGIRYLI